MARKKVVAEYSEENIQEQVEILERAIYGNKKAEKALAVLQGKIILIEDNLKDVLVENDLDGDYSVDEETGEMKRVY